MSSPEPEQRQDQALIWMKIFESVQESWKLQLDGMEGMINEAMRRGFTRDQACAMVAYVFGWRPAPEPPTESPGD